MTKEEIRNIIELFISWNGEDCPIDISNLDYAIEYINDCIKSSLPSNLDEAAEEYAYNNWEDNDYHTGASEGLPFDAIGHTEKCFKAGAEWMAGQGVDLKCWIARDECSGDGSDLYIGQQKPRRVPGAATGFGMWCDYGEFMALPTDMFPELTYSDEPIEVELIIRKK